VGIVWVDRDRTTDQAGACEGCRVEVEPVHHRAPCRSAVCRTENTAVGRAGVEDTASRSDDESCDAAADRLAADGLSMDNHRGAERDAVPCTGHERRRDEASDWGRRRRRSSLSAGRLALLVFE